MADSSLRGASGSRGLKCAVLDDLGISPAEAEEIMYNCGACNLTKPESATTVVQHADPVKGVQEQRRCKLCHNLRTRLRRIETLKQV